MNWSTHSAGKSKVKQILNVFIFCFRCSPLVTYANISKFNLKNIPKNIFESLNSTFALYKER